MMHVFLQLPYVEEDLEKSQVLKSLFDHGFEMAWGRKKKKPLSDLVSERGAMLLEDLIECCDGKSNPIKFFSADEILKATDNFSESNHISELSKFGYEWYSGKTENHHMILIKKVVRMFKFSQFYFCRDIAVSSMVSGHKNFRKLIGCCLDFEYPVLVYYGVKKQYKLDIKEQTWKRRMKIAEDIATALAYLHNAFPRPFIYRRMGLWNIFLDEDGVAKLSDFSFCVLIPKGETLVQVDTIVGTYAYMDKKYRTTGVVSEEMDVFAIGKIMRNLLMGLDRGYHWFHDDDEEEDAKEEGDSEGDDDPKRQFQSRLPKLIKEGRVDEIADPDMVEKMDAISEQELCQMKAFGMLSLRCMGHKGEEVPKMVEVAKELKKIQRSLRNSSSPSDKTQFDSAQDISSSASLSNKS